VQYSLLVEALQGTTADARCGEGSGVIYEVQSLNLSRRQEAMFTY
jgi:hypothetical protein